MSVSLWSVWLYHIFPYYHKRYDFGGKKVIGFKMFFDFLYDFFFFEKFPSLRRFERDINIHRSECKASAILVGF